MPMLPQLRLLNSIPLYHNEDCNLIGFTKNSIIYVEENYGEGEWVAQYAFDTSGKIIESVDENGLAGSFSRFHLPEGSVEPQVGEKTAFLNFSGSRLRGMRETDRILDMVQPLSIAEKFRLIERFGLNILPPQLLGVAESYVMAEARFPGSEIFVICRRIRLAYALPEPKVDETNLAYDYDTLTLVFLQMGDLQSDTDFSLANASLDLADTHLNRPLDCLIAGQSLFIADGGSADQLSRIHIYQIEPA
jgi:hypothetical protein